TRRHVRSQSICHQSAPLTSYLLRLRSSLLLVSLLHLHCCFRSSVCRVRRPSSSCVRVPAMALQQAPASSLQARAPAAPLRSSFSTPWSVRLPAPARRRAARAATAARITMRVASKQAYICRDCGYIYNDRTPFDKLSDNYFCPVCGAPKRRFRPYEPKVSKDANATDVRKARKEQLKKDEAIGQALPIAIAVGVIALAALYFYLNSTYN
ncbi:unnamed protein product, partial [Urochloa humidicola]